MTADLDCAAIEHLITRLVREAPPIDPAIADELVDRLRHVGSPLAVSIARVVELLPEDLVDPGLALPALAMACATLGDAVSGTLTTTAIEAARFEIETLLPVPSRRPALVRPDVPAEALIRGPRRRS